MCLARPAVCPRCGLPNPQGNQSCPRCGSALLEGAATERPETPTPAAPKLPHSEPSVPAGSPSGATSPAPYGHGLAGPPRGSVPRADTVSIFIETFRAWTKDVPALLGLFLVYGAGVVGILLGTTAVLVGTAFPTSRDLASSFSSPTAGDVAAYLQIRAIASVMSGVLGAIFTGAVTYYVVCRRRGAPVGWPAAFRMGARRFESVLVGSLVFSLLGVAELTLQLLPFMARNGGLSSLVTGTVCGLLLLSIPLIYLQVALVLYAPSAMMEGVGAVESLRRSWSLTRGHRWSIFGAEVLLGLILFLVGEVVDGTTITIGSPLASAVGNIAATMVTGSWSIILASVAYELVGEERREMDRQQAARAWLATLTARAPAYQQPGAPFCTICGRPLLWVPAYSRWYCAQCAGYR